MKNLIKLQLRKNLLSFAVILGAVLVSVPLALVIKSRAMSAREAVNLAMFYWAIAGIPLIAMIFSGIAGAEAAKEQSENIEQPLPVSQYSLLLSSLAATLLELAVLILAVWAILGFSIPLAVLNEFQKQIYHFYIFSIVYLVLYGLTLSYAFKNGIAGAALAVVSVISTVFPIISMAVFQGSAIELIPLWLLKPAIVAMALAAGVLALKLLSGISGRKEGWTTAKISALILLLAAPVLASFSALAWLNLEGRKLTLPVSVEFPPLYGADRYIYAACDRQEAASLMLVQKPFSGEVFFIDKEGHRSVIDAGGEQGKLGFYNLFQDISVKRAKTLSRSTGEKWILFTRRAGSQILSGTMKAGFTVRAAVDRSAWGMNLLGGKEPGILDRRNDEYYYSPLPQGNDGLEWKKVASGKVAYMSFLGERYYREGAAASLRKDGETLEYRGRRWTVPGALLGHAPVIGVELADGRNFIVPAKTRGGYTTYLCRPDGKVEAIWPDHFRLAQNLSVTSDGLVWGMYRMTSEFYLLAFDGTALSAVNTDRIRQKTGIVDIGYGEITPLKMRDGYVWFNAGNKYLVKADAKNTGDMKIWKLPPQIPRKKGWPPIVGAVSAAPDGVFIAAADGVYFMDWDGNNKKIY